MVKKMKQHDKLLSVTPIKALVLLGVPSVLMQLIDELNGIIDAIFMGQFFGSEAVASMSIIFPYMILIFALGVIFSSGAMIIIGKYLGAKNIESANKIFMNTVVVTFVLGILIGVIGYFITPKILSIYSITEGTREFALIYMQIISLGLPIMLLSTLLNEIIYTEGHSKISLYLAIFQLISNVIMNYILIKTLHLGVFSIAIATIISMCLEVIFMAKYIQSDKMSLKFKVKDIVINRNYFKEIIPVGIPAFVTMILLSITLGIESKVISNFGSDALSVQTITGYIFSATSSVATGILSAAIVLMSYSVGAKNINRFKKLLKISLISVFISTLLLNIPLVFKSEFVVRMFTESASVTKIIKIPALVYGLTAPFIFVTNVYLYAMQPIGMERVSTVIFTLQQLVLFLPLLFIMKNFGFYYAISAQPMAEILGGIITIILIPYFYKQLKLKFQKIK